MTAQAQVLKPVKVDNLITVSLPADYSKRDTLGQTILSGTASLGYIVVIKAPNPAGQPLKKEKDLKKVLKEYTTKVQQSSGNGEIWNLKDTIVNNVEVRNFTLATEGDQGNQLRTFRVLYTKPATYTFQYTYPEERADLAKKEMAQFFASIKTAPSFDGTDQYATFGQFTGMHKGLKFALIGGGVIILIIVIMIIVRNRRKQELVI